MYQLYPHLEWMKTVEIPTNDGEIPTNDGEILLKSTNQPGFSFPNRPNRAAMRLMQQTLQVSLLLLQYLVEWFPCGFHEGSMGVLGVFHVVSISFPCGFSGFTERFFSFQSWISMVMTLGICCDSMTSQEITSHSWKDPDVQPYWGFLHHGSQIHHEFSRLSD